jgi:hypothetical protein
MQRPQEQVPLRPLFQSESLQSKPLHAFALHASALVSSALLSVPGLRRCQVANVHGLGLSHEALLHFGH